MQRSPKSIAKAFMDMLNSQDLSMINITIDELGIMSKCVKSLRLPSFFKNPGLNSREKSEWIKRFSDALGCSDVTLKLTITLLNEGLLPSIGKVVASMKEQRLARYNIGEAEVITVAGLTADQREKAEKLIKKMCGYDKVIMNEKTNPNIMGGIIINSGDMLYEGTIKRQLKNMLKIVS